MHPKSYPVQIWFLDCDLETSAKYLTNKTLTSSINGCLSAIVTTYFYYLGIRNIKAYKYYFDKDRKTESLDRFFPMWPLKDKPSFKQYTSKTSKWCRQCSEHLNYVKQYLSVLLDEYEFRFKRIHNLGKFLEWLEFDAPKIKIPTGHLTKIVIPWKNLNPRYRRADLIEGYRLQFMHKLQNDPYVEYERARRDIPDFIVKYYHLDADSNVHLA